MSATASARVASAMLICDEGDLVGLATRWPEHPPVLWVALAATSTNERCLEWIRGEERTKHADVVGGVARALAARVAGGAADAATLRAARRLRLD